MRSVALFQIAQIAIDRHPVEWGYNGFLWRGSGSGPRMDSPHKGPITGDGGGGGGGVLLCYDVIMDSHTMESMLHLTLSHWSFDKKVRMTHPMTWRHPECGEIKKKKKRATIGSSVKGKYFVGATLTLLSLPASDVAKDVTKTTQGTANDYKIVAVNSFTFHCSLWDDTYNFSCGKARGLSVGLRWCGVLRSRFPRSRCTNLPR